MLDLSPCRLGSLTSLGHCAYTMRRCPQCAGAYAACTVCPSLGELCPGCRHRAVLAHIKAGERVYAADEPGVALPVVEGHIGDQAHWLTHGDQAGELDATPIALYNHGIVESPDISDSSTALGAGAMVSPVFVLVLPLVSQDLGHVLQALAPVLAGNGRTNGHSEADGQRLPRLPRKTYVSDKPCPHGHTSQDTGKVLRFRGNNMCTQCAAQTKPRRTAARTATTEG